VLDGNDLETVDSVEIARIAGVDGQLISQRSGRDHSVVRARSSLATYTAKRSGHPAEGTGRRGIEGYRIEIGFGLLEVDLPRSAFFVRPSNQGADRKLGQGYGGDNWLSGQLRRIGQSREKDDCGRIEHASRVSGHDVLKRTVQQPVDVRPERLRVNQREGPPAPEERFRRELWLG